MLGRRLFAPFFNSCTHYLTQGHSLWLLLQFVQCHELFLARSQHHRIVCSCGVAGHRCLWVSHRAPAFGGRVDRAWSLFHVYSLAIYWRYRPSGDFIGVRGHGSLAWVAFFLFSYGRSSFNTLISICLSLCFFFGQLLEYAYFNRQRSRLFWFFFGERMFTLLSGCPGVERYADKFDSWRFCCCGGVSSQSCLVVQTMVSQVILSIRSVFYCQCQACVWLQLFLWNALEPLIYRDERHGSCGH